MEHFSVIFFSLCPLAILAGSIPIGSSTTIETLRDNAYGVEKGNVENHQEDLLKQNNMQNNTNKHLLLDENLVKNTTQVGEHTKNSLYLNKASDASTISTGDFPSSYIKDTQHLGQNGDRKDDDKEEPSVGLSSHDILLDPGLIPVCLTRQAEKSDADYSNLASIENVSSDVESNNYDEKRSVVSSKRSANLEGDLDVAEDRYQPPYPYWNPYYRGQFPNQRYRANDRREPYRDYWRYPVFPGK